MTDPALSNAGSTGDFGADDAGSLRLLPTVNLLLRRRRTVLGCTAAFVAVAVVSVLLVAPAWTSTAKFQPVAGRGVVDRMETASSEDETTSADYYVALIQSPSFLADVAARSVQLPDGAARTIAELSGQGDAAGPDGLQRAADALSKSITVSASRGVGSAPRIVTLTATAGSPQLAAQVANAILDQVNRHNASVRKSKSTETRIFVEGQLGGCKTELDAAAAALAQFETRNRRTDAPRIAAQLEQLRRDVRVAEERYLTLARQLELVRIEEQENVASISVIQVPEPPISRSSPRRTQTVVIAAVLGLLAGCAWALISERLRGMPSDDPEAAEFRGHLRSLVRLGR